MALQFDEGRIERVVQKIVRGLYYFEYGEALAAETEVMTLFLSTKARFETAVGYAQSTWLGEATVAGDLRVPLRSRTWCSSRVFWLMRCYSNTHFWAISGSDEALTNTVG